MREYTGQPFETISVAADRVVRDLKFLNASEGLLTFNGVFVYVFAESCSADICDKYLLQQTINYLEKHKK